MVVGYASWIPVNPFFLHMHLSLLISHLTVYRSHIKMVKREYQEIEDEDDIDSLTPDTKIKEEVINDTIVTISSAKTTPKKKSKSQSSKSTDGVESPDTPKTKSPAKSVSPSTSKSMTCKKRRLMEAMVPIRG